MFRLGFLATLAPTLLHALCLQGDESVRKANEQRWREACEAR